MLQERPRILVFIDWFAPGYKAGGPTTSNVNIVEHLKDKFDFFIITSDTDYHESSPYPHVCADSWVGWNGAHVYYFSHKSLSFRAMKKCIEEANCNTWYINGIYSRFFSIYPLILAKLLKPKCAIVSARGMLSPHALAIKHGQKMMYLNTARCLCLFKDIIFHATNEEEANYIREIFGKCTAVYPIENLPRKMALCFHSTSKLENEIKLVSFARVSPEKNTLFAIECLKLCKRTVAYHIYGQINSTEYWKKCQEVINNLPENVTVEYKGTVSPNEMSKIYRNYHFLYLPSTGENFGHAILESFMNSTPVIISDRTPWTGLQRLNIGCDLPLDNQDIIAETIDNYAKMSDADYQIMTKAAYEFAAKICNDSAIVEKYEELFCL